MNRIPHILFIVLITIVGTVTMAPALLAYSEKEAEQSVADPLSGITQTHEPTTVSLAWNTYGFSVTPLGQASLLSVRIAGPNRVILLDQRPGGTPIDWTLPGGAPDGSYRYEVYVSTTLDEQSQSHLTAGGFEVQNGQILRP